MKQYSPAAERNKEPILEVLNPLLPRMARVLEVASGSGQHAAFVCGQRPDIVWQPSDVDEDALKSIRAFQQECASPAMKEPIKWSIIDPAPSSLHGPYDLVVSINMIHIAPWSACQCLMKHASQLLSASGTLFIYGPFLLKGRDTAPSNLDFDRSLKVRNPLWGLRELERVKVEAKVHGLDFHSLVDMPANNLSVIFKKQGS